MKGWMQVLFLDTNSFRNKIGTTTSTTFTKQTKSLWLSGYTRCTCKSILIYRISHLPIKKKKIGTTTVTKQTKILFDRAFEYSDTAFETKNVF